MLLTLILLLLFLINLFTINLLNVWMHVNTFIFVLWKNMLKYIKNFMYLKNTDLFFSSISFILLLLLICNSFIKFMPYSFINQFNFNAVLFVGLIFWMSTLLYNILAERAFKMFDKKNESFLITLFLILIEFLSIISRPLSLSVRLYANLLFGHYLLLYSYLFMMPMSSMSFFVMLLLMVYELCVLAVQTFVYIYLIKIYLNE